MARKKAKLRILHTESSLGWGGQEIRILTESQIFSQHGHEVLLAADVGSQIAKKAIEYDVNVYPIRLKKKRWSDFKALRQLIQQKKPDIISCHSSTDHWLSALARLTLRHKPAIVRTRHVSASVHRNMPTRWLYNKGAETLMTTGEFIREHLLQNQFVNPGSVFSVPTGIDTERYVVGDQATQRAKLHLPLDHFIFGIVATLRSWKGHEYLIRAFDLLDNPQATLIIVGDGPQMERCKHLATQVGYPNNIRLVGNQSNVIPYLQAMDCFVLPSYANEGVPQALLQAMSVGLPVIGCPTGGIPESMAQYPQGTLVPIKDATTLSKAMMKQMEKRLQEQRGRNRHTPFTLEGMYQSALKVYELARQKVINRT